MGRDEIMTGGTQAKTELKKVYIVTGISGAGKSTVLRVFEDMRFFAVDGLPASLAPEMAAMMQRESMRHFAGIAIGMDLRQENFLNEILKAVEKLRSDGANAKLIFVEADDNAIMRRYAATRRPHPLERKGLGLAAAIVEERSLLEPVRAMADIIINSTGFSIHDLRRAIQRLVRDGNGKSLLRINLISFGFKYGLPADADFVFDLRSLPNPYFVEHLRPLNGHDAEVAKYVFDDEAAREYRRKVSDFLITALADMENEGRWRVTVAFGCTGGRHRSIAMVDAVADRLRSEGYTIVTEDRSLDKESAKY